MKTHQNRLAWIFARLEGTLMGNSRQILSVFLIGISMLLSAQALACFCPPCPPCHSQTGGYPNCNCSYDCMGCQSCVSNACVNCGGDPTKACCDNTTCYSPNDDKCCGYGDGTTCDKDFFCCDGGCHECCDDSHCGDCEKCENNSCQPCKCWDTGSDIGGSISGSDACICETVTHSASVSDTDHWVDGDSNEGNPSDTISEYTWSSEAGTACDAGTFVSQNGSSADWQAPSTLGTVIIKLEADDAPDAVYDECPNSSNDDRDDDPNNFETTVSVSLPGGCEECGGDEISITLTPVEGVSGCGICECGNTEYSDMSYSADYPCYIDDCENGSIWKFRLDAQAFVYYGNCGDFTDISGPDDVNANNYCEVVEGFNYDPEVETEAGCVNGWADPPVGKYSNSDCIDLHEETHAYMGVEAFNYRIGVLLDSGIFELGIDCSEPSTTDCFGAYLMMGPDIYLGIEDALDYAEAEGSDEDLPRAVASQCFRDIADDICGVWDCDACN